ncbi:MAG: nucleotidyltransferase family protein [bacterium]
MCNYSQYVKTYKQKIEKQKKDEKKLFKMLNKKARKAAKKLGQEFNIERVYLFGSLTNKNKFSLNSDIDLAVKGLDPVKFLEAWGVLEDYLNYDFDLVQFEKANENLKNIIIKEGVIIYDARQKKS